VKTKLLDAVESKSLKKKIPHFEIGDTVDVRCKIKEGDKERVQVFTGTVIARRGRGINETFTVRRIVGNEGWKGKAGKTILPPQKNRKRRKTRSSTQRTHRLRIVNAQSCIEPRVTSHGPRYASEQTKVIGRPRTARPMG
jgi:hypothetical protein